MFFDNASAGQRDDMSPFRFQSVRSRHFVQALPMADRSRDRPWRRPEHRLPECVRAGVNSLSASGPNFPAAAHVSFSGPPAAAADRRDDCCDQCVIAFQISSRNVHL